MEWRQNKGEEWRIEEKRGTWMGRGTKIDIVVHCQTLDMKQTYDGAYDSNTNELTFYHPTEADAWKGVVHFVYLNLPVNGPYIEWNNEKQWVAKNWKWWSNTVKGAVELAALAATYQHVNTLKGKLTTAQDNLWGQYCDTCCWYKEPCCNSLKCQDIKREANLS